MRRLCLLLSFLFILGEGAAAASLVGTWVGEVPDGRLTLTFEADGRLSMSLGDQANATVGDWSLAGSTLTMHLGDPQNGEVRTFVCDLVLNEESLTIQPGEEQCGTTTLQRQN